MENINPYPASVENMVSSACGHLCLLLIQQIWGKNKNFRILSTAFAAKLSEN
jgi:hypothetical protein